MNPSVKDRLGSVVRALNGVVLPALPKEASLAQEQVMLAMGHIQIILAQMDAEPEFLADEAADLEILANKAAALANGGPMTLAAKSALETALQQNKDAVPAVKTAALQDATDSLLQALASDGDPAARSATTAAILEQGAIRADKDRKWFAAMGFDIDYSGG
jgi:hypothetical protein